MKNKILIFIIVAIVFVLGLYKISNYTEPYKFANEISKLNISYSNKVISFSRLVGDFDGSVDMQIEFSISENELQNLEDQCKNLNFKHPSLSLTKKNPKYSGDINSIYFFSKNNENGSEFVIFNRTKKIILIKQNTIN
ncbi:hypothetical protein [Flavobacterium sp. KJJ]|uniref:hypothetical protein n=1 Tax=Flavobacterium sp. KJJ TaxID=1270193 RepID=UPI0004939136|nr:hypothetical protein [Flavobacterium sp. KJJ]